MVVDFIIIAIIVLFAYISYKKGLTGCILKIMSLIISIVIAIILYIPVSNFIVNNTPIWPKVEEAITNTFITTENDEVKVKDTAPNAIQDYLNEVITDTTNAAKEVTVEAVAKGASEAIIRVTTLIVLIILSNIILLVVRIFANILTDLPIIKQVDKIGGVAYGIIEALLIIYVILAILSFINNEFIKTNINDSFIGNMMYNNNIILNIFFK